MRKFSFLHWIDQCLARMGKALVISAMLLLAVMTFLIALQVVSRNLFNLGLPWADELARFTGIASVFFAIPLLQYQEKHIAVDLFVNRVGGLAGKGLKLVNEVVVLGFCLLFLFSLTRFLERAASFSTPAMGLPNWFFYAPVLMGMVMCTLVAVLRMICLIRTGQATLSQNPTPLKGPQL